MKKQGMPSRGVPRKGGGGGGGRMTPKPKTKTKNFMEKSPSFTNHPSGTYIEKATGNVYNSAGKLVAQAGKKSTAAIVKNRAKKIATSSAAKDAKKVAKVAGGAGAIGYGMKKVNENAAKEQKRYQDLMNKYKKSASYGKVSFEQWLKMGGK